MNNTYLIYGNDYGLVKREIDKLTEGCNDVAKYDLSVDKVDDVLDDASCMSLFGDKKIIVGENSLFLATTPTNVVHNLDYLSKYLEDNARESIVILSVITDKLDERKKIVKLLKQKAKVIHKEIIEEKNLENFVIDEFKAEDYKIDYKTASYFISYVGKNVDIILSEINKMIVYKDDDKTVTTNDIDAISSKAFKDNVFDLTGGIMKKDYKKIFECYNDLMILNEEPIKLIALLGSQFTLIYQSKVLSDKGYSQKDIASELKVHPYRVLLALQTDYKLKEIEKILVSLHNLDFNIKSGLIDKNSGLENFLLHL